MFLIYIKIVHTCHCGFKQAKGTQFFEQHPSKPAMLYRVLYIWGNYAESDITNQFS